MANTIKIKRGLEANRSSVTPAEGEFLYTTDTKKVFIGDGTTAGGNSFGDVVGPASATDNTLPLFDGTTGKLLKGTLGSGTAGQILQSGGSGNAPVWANATGATLPLEERTSDTMLAAADQGKYIKLTGNFTQTFDSAATLGNGWYCYLENTANPDVSAGLRLASLVEIPSANWPNGTSIRQICFNADCTRVYYIQNNTTNTVYQANLSVANDITTAGAATAKNIGNISTSGTALCFGNNGSKFYASSSSVIYQYTCSTPYDVTTAVYDSISFNPGLSIFGMRINADGTQIYISNSTTSFRTITLSTPWSLSGATASATQTASAVKVSSYFDISPDGKNLIAGSESYGVWYYELSTAFDFTTATLVKRTYLNNDSNSDSFISNVAFTSDGNIASIAPNTNPAACVLGAPVPYKAFRASDSFGVNDITLDPNGSQTIDGRTTMLLYPNEIRLVMCDGSNLKSVPFRGFVRHFQTTSNFYMPSGYSEIEVTMWGGGGAGRTSNGSGGSGGGGGGSACVIETFNPSKISDTIRVTIGAGGVSSDGGITSFGAYASVYGGKSGTSTSSLPGAGGQYFKNINDVANIGSNNYHGIYGPGYTGGTNVVGGFSIYAGGSGGGGHTSSTVGKRGGTSFYGSGAGGSGAVNQNDGGQGGATGGGVTINISSSDINGAALGGAPGMPTTSNNIYIPDTVVPFGCGGGGGSCGSSALVSAGANGGLGGGGGGGGGYHATSFVTAAGGNGGNGFLIVRGVI